MIEGNPEKNTNLSIAYFGLIEEHLKLGYAKWFSVVYNELIDSGINARFIRHNRYLFNEYTNKTTIFPYLYLEYIMKKNVLNKGFKIDILHVLSQVSYYYRLSNLSKVIINKIPTVMTVHDIFNKYGKIIPINQKLKNIDFIFTPSRYTAKTLRSTGVEAPIFVVYNPVDDKIFCPLPEQKRDKYKRVFLKKHKLPQDSKLVLYVGTDKPSKNVEGLLYTLSILKKSFDNIYLIKVGITSRKQELEKLSEKLGIKRNIIWISKVSDIKLSLLYNISDVFLTLSIAEGFGMPIVEAMACKTPAVATNVTAIPEITKKSAILVNPHDYEKTADVIVKILLSRSYSEKISARGLKRAKYFSPIKIKNRYVHAYNKVVYNL